MSITFIDSNTTLIYQPTDAWKDSFYTSPTSNIATGSLHLTSSVAASVTFTFPVPAFAFSIWGIKHSNGGNYSLCYNCNFPNATIVNIDGYDPTDNGHNTPVLIYSTSFPSPSTLTVVLSNMQDSRGTPFGNSQLTIAQFVLNTTQSSTALTAASVSSSIRSTATVRSSGSLFSSITQSSSNIPISASSTTPSTTPSTDSAPSPTSISTSSPLPISPSSTTVAINNSNNTTRTSNRRISPGIMAAVGVAAALLLMIALVFLVRWRRRRHSRAVPSDSAAAHPYYSRWGMGAEGAGTHQRVSKGAPPEVRRREKAPRSRADEEEGAAAPAGAGSVGAVGKFAAPRLSAVRRGKAAAAPGSAGSVGGAGALSVGAGESSSCLLPASDRISVGRGGGSGVGDGDVQGQGDDHAGLGAGGAGARRRMELLPPHYGDVFE